MKSTTKIETAVSYGQELHRKLILLAYLEYHYDNPCLHPDDVYSADGGYDGIGPVIVYLTNLQEIPPYIKYPSELLQLNYALGNVLPQTETELQHIEVVKDFLDTFEETLLPDVIYSLKELSDLDESAVIERVKEIFEYVALQ